MKRIIILILICLLCLGGCTRRSDVTESQAPQAESGGSKEEVHRAEDANDAAWAWNNAGAARAEPSCLRVEKRDGSGNLVQWVDHALDSQGLLQQETVMLPGGSADPDEYRKTYEYINGFLVAHNEYDASNRLVYRYKYNEQGLVWKWILYDDAGEVRMWYEDAYDDHGSLISHTLYQPGAEPKIMNLREYDYNEQGLPTECRYMTSGGTVLSRHSYSYAFDANGNVAERKVVEPDSASVQEWFRYEYDSAGRITVKEQYEAGEGDVINEYDDAGRLIEVKETVGGDRCIIRTLYSYDESGRLIREEIYNAAGELAVTMEYIWQ